MIGSLVGILSDIQKKQLKQIEQANLQMYRIDKMSLLGQLAAGLAHEIRNPLGSLIGSDEILADLLEKLTLNTNLLKSYKKNTGGSVTSSMNFFHLPAHHRHV